MCLVVHDFGFHHLNLRTNLRVLTQLEYLQPIDVRHRDRCLTSINETDRSHWQSHNPQGYIPLDVAPSSRVPPKACAKSIIQLYLQKVTLCMISQASAKLNHLSHLNVQTQRVVNTPSCVVPISRGSFNFQPTLLCFSIDFSSIVLVLISPLLISPPWQSKYSAL